MPCDLSKRYLPRAVGGPHVAAFPRVESYSAISTNRRRDAACLDATYVHPSACSRDLHIECAGPHAETTRFESIDAIGKEWVQCHGRAVGRDLESEHRAHAEERRCCGPSLRTARDRVCLRWLT